MKLIIVESPTKAKTISKFLDKSYKVESSFGHIRDLPKSELGIDVEKNFEPRYVIPTKNRKQVNSLKKLASDATEVILASDEDREGEAIAWHLFEALSLNDEKTKRIVFHEVTKDAILESLENPKNINLDMVDAQQARRVLDRLVGYKLSPFLWKKVAKGLSAGRVQSVATRMIVEREKEIKAFKSQKYASLTAFFIKNEADFSSELYKINNKTYSKLDLSKEKAQEIKESIVNSDFTVTAINKKELNKKTGTPFTTSTLQQAANRFLGFSAKQTMMVAQKLYEQGYITYMRTDSLNLSSKFIEEARSWIEINCGKKYLPEKANYFKNKNKNAQEAHEAIRPTKAENSPDNLEKKLDNNQLRLYKLIWQKSISCQMVPAKLSAETIDIEGKNDNDQYLFRSTGQLIKFDGFLKIWPEKTKEQKLPEVKENEVLKLKEMNIGEHETMPPARYSDASLVKEMEKHGVGRPSTYAPTINTIITRNYVQRNEDKRLEPTEIAFVVTDLLIKHFNKIVNYGFTANLENDLDEIAFGKKEWQPVISNFYQDFNSNLENKYNEINKEDIMPEEETTEKCDKCGAQMVMKTSRFGKFLACSAYPDCKNIKNNNGDKNDPKNKELSELEKKHANTKCDKCGEDMVIKSGKYGPFLACSGYPKCKNIKNIDSGNEKSVKCPICQDGSIVKKFSKRGAFYACDNYPKCKNAYWGKPTGDKCKKCEGLMIEDLKTKKIKCSNKDCS